MDGGVARVVDLALAACALLAVRGVVAGFEAALVSVGLARARVLATDARAARRGNALVALLSDPETSAALLRFVDSFAALGAGVLAGVAGLLAVPGEPALGAAVAIAAALFLSLLFTSATRALGARHGQPIALALAPTARRLAVLVAPFARAMGCLARPIAGSKGRYALPTPPIEEIERALTEHVASSDNPSAQSTSELIHAVFRFRDRIARDVMVPRTEIVAIEIDTPVPEILRLLAEEGHSRIPVYRENLDQVAGTLHARDLVPLLEHPQLIILRDILRPAHFVPWSKPVDQLLREMQNGHIHMTMVVDEYGGVMGICTLEDVLEEIVGEIGDEFEEEEGRRVEVHGDGTFTARGDAPVAEFNRVAGAQLPETGQYETIGGFLNSLAGAIPVSGDRFFHGGWLFTISEATPRRVLKVRAARVKRAIDRDVASRPR
jgi:CBS domain containing-hemolysin-like protein